MSFGLFVRLPWRHSRFAAAHVGNRDRALSPARRHPRKLVISSNNSTGRIRTTRCRSSRRRSTAHWRPPNLATPATILAFSQNQGSFRPVPRDGGWKRREKFDAGHRPPNCACALPMTRATSSRCRSPCSPVLYYNKAAFKKAGQRSEQAAEDLVGRQDMAGKLRDAGLRCYTTSWLSWIHIDNTGRSTPANCRRQGQLQQPCPGSNTPHVAGELVQDQLFQILRSSRRGRPALRGRRMRHADLVPSWPRHCAIRPASMSASPRPYYDDSNGAPAHAGRTVLRCGSARAGSLPNTRPRPPSSSSC